MRTIVQPTRIRLHYDFCRPASWLSVALALAATVFASTEAAVSAIFAVVTAAVVTAVGEVPAVIPQWTGMTAVNRRGWRRLGRSNISLPGGLGWLFLRLLWPAMGFVLGNLLAGFFWPLSLLNQVEILAVGILAVGLSGATLAWFLVVGLTPADAASATLLAGGLAAGGVVGTEKLTVPPTAGVLVLVGAVGWLLCVTAMLAVFCWLSSQSGEPLVGRLPRMNSSSSPRAVDQLASISLLGVLPARSPWRRFLRVVVMGGLLAGMVVWLLLVPNSAPRYTVVALICFGGLAIPTASLLDGRQVRQGWQRLVNVTATRSSWRCSIVPDTPSQTLVVFIGHAAVVLWPPLVVAVVALGGPGGLAAVSVVAAVASSVSVITLGCFVSALLGVRGETTLGIGLLLWACSLWGVGSQLLGG